MNSFTLYPNWFSKLLPAIWSYAVAQAAHDMNSGPNATTIQISRTSVIETNPLNIIYDPRVDDVPVVVATSIGEDEDGDEDVDEDVDGDGDEDPYAWLEWHEWSEGEFWRTSPEASYAGEYLDEYSDMSHNKWYGYIMEEVYGIDLDAVPSVINTNDIETDANPQLTMQYIQYGLRANMKIRDQICVSGMVIMSVSTVLLVFCILISCCTGRNTRRVVNDALKEPLLKLDELGRLVNGNNNNNNNHKQTHVPSPTTTSVNKQVVVPGGIADGEIIVESGDGSPCTTNPASASFSLTLV